MSEFSALLGNPVLFSTCFSCCLRSSFDAVFGHHSGALCDFHGGFWDLSMADPVAVYFALSARSTPQACIFWCVFLHVFGGFKHVFYAKTEVYTLTTLLENERVFGVVR